MKKAQVKQVKKKKKVTFYRNVHMEEFQEGTRVRLRPKIFKLFVIKPEQQEQFAGLEITQARVVYVFPDIPRLVSLQHRLGGYWTWDVNELEVVG